MAKEMVFVMVAGEISGDILGAGLIKELIHIYPNAKFTGIGGPSMEALGFQSIYSFEELAVMGITEVLSRIPRLVKIRSELITLAKKQDADCFIGIDAPDFNIGLELKLKKIGIKTVHYVSPSVWAWRPKRIFKIAKAVNHVLCLLPFEVKFYQQHNVPSTFVGHHLADEIAFNNSKEEAKVRLGLDLNKSYIAMLPGSRMGEINLLGASFLETLKLVHDLKPDLEFIVPLVNVRIKDAFLSIKQNIAPDLNLTIIDGQSRDVMSAADAILLASGTAALEGMLIKRPMVTAYKVSATSYLIAKFLVTTKKFSLPNLLSNEDLVPEFIQNDIDPKKMANALLSELANDFSKTENIYIKLHKELRCNGSKIAAQVIKKLLDY